MQGEIESSRRDDPADFRVRYVHGGAKSRRARPWREKSREHIYILYAQHAQRQARRTGVYMPHGVCMWLYRKRPVCFIFNKGEVEISHTRVRTHVISLQLSMGTDAYFMPRGVARASLYAASRTNGVNGTYARMYVDTYRINVAIASTHNYSPQDLPAVDEINVHGSAINVRVTKCQTIPVQSSAVIKGSD